MSSTGFTAREGHAIAAVLGSDTTFMIIGGSNLWTVPYFNDALLTINGGTTFVTKSSSVFSTGRSNSGLVKRATAWVAFGGESDYGQSAYNEVRQSEDDGSTWTILRATGGSGSSCTDPTLWSERGSFAYAYLPVMDRIVLAGGTSSSGGYTDDVWASDDGGTCWTELVADTNTGSGYYGAALVTVRNSVGVEMLLLAGGLTTSGALATVQLSLNGGTAWSLVASGASQWDERHLFAFVHDPVNQRVALFGGYKGLGGNAPLFLDDLWTASVGALGISPTEAPTEAPTEDITLILVGVGLALCCIMLCLGVITPLMAWRFKRPKGPKERTKRTKRTVFA
jgi:hypothetical protein